MKVLLTSGEGFIGSQATGPPENVLRAVCYDNGDVTRRAVADKKFERRDLLRTELLPYSYFGTTK